jgi:aspartyl/asparaginyl beta-hydroxylase (cupin superfamily)
MKPKLKPTYMIYGGRFSGSEPFFYDPKDFSWVKQLEENWSIIQEEAQALLKQHPNRLQPYFNQALSFPPEHWKTLGFYFWKYKFDDNCRECPRTVRILESIPNMTAGSLSVLEPGSNINPHYGDTNAIIRVHLGLSVPAPLPDCGFQVGDEVREWKEGRALLFCDTHYHSAWNKSDQRRLVLIVDVMRPEFADQTDTICVHVLTSMFLQSLYQRLPWLHVMPGWLLGAAHFLMRFGTRVWLSNHRRGVSKRLTLI